VSETAAQNGPAAWQTAFLAEHGLATGYLQHAQIWFKPLCDTLAAHCNGADLPRLVAVNGCQGSGKTTLCAYLVARLEAEHGLRALSLSLDDFYLPLAARKALGREVHPLLATRGVPGTHDMVLLQATLDALLAPQPSANPVAVPRFDKSRDDRRPAVEWEQVTEAVDLVLLEGWCLGALAQDEGALRVPVNDLERDEDGDCRWREYVNAALVQDFPALYQRVNEWVMLQAPSFASVYRWRLEQERKLRASAGAGAEGVMTDPEVARFIQHYQRLTDVCLATLPARVQHLYTLDPDRNITAYHAGEGAQQ
jgi:D-glycerate 3-kinase